MINQIYQKVIAFAEKRMWICKYPNQSSSEVNEHKRNTIRGELSDADQRQNCRTWVQFCSQSLYDRKIFIFSFERISKSRKINVNRFFDISSSSRVKGPCNIYCITGPVQNHLEPNNVKNSAVTTRQKS